MCGGSLGTPFRRAFDNVWDPLSTNWSSASELVGNKDDWNEWVQKNLDKYDLLPNTPIKSYVREQADYYHNRDREAAAKERFLARERVVNPAPGAPVPSAMIVNPASAVRDRRRRAILSGISQLRTFGPGGATGGINTGANIPLL